MDHVETFAIKMITCRLCLVVILCINFIYIALTIHQYKIPVSCLFRDKIVYNSSIWENSNILINTRSFFSLSISTAYNLHTIFCQ